MTAGSVVGVVVLAAARTQPAVRRVSSVQKAWPDIALG